MRVGPADFPSEGRCADRGFETARRIPGQLPMIHATSDGHARAAPLFRSLRRKGVAVRGAVDCIIAQACLDTGAGS